MDELHREEPGALLRSTSRPGRFASFASLGALAFLACAPASGGVSANSPPASAPDSAQVAREVVALLQASVQAWNRDDLDAFLADYSDDADLTLVGAAEVIRGKDAVRAHYEAAYFDGGEPDDLSFDELRVRPLGSGFALAHGRWTLYTPGFETQPITGRGRFSLVLRKEDGRWRILHDHSS